MVSMETDPVDYLPYIDGSITHAEREAVEQLIRAESASDSGNRRMLHPLVGELAPLSENRSLLMRHVGAYELEDPNGEVPDTFFPAGIKMERYSDFINGDMEDDGDEENIDHDKMYTALLYSVLRERNAQLGVDNAEERARAASLMNENIQALDNSQRIALLRKRDRVDEINSQRQAKQVQFHPVQGYLEHRWKDGIKNLVDVGIEKLEGAERSG